MCFTNIFINFLILLCFSSLNICLKNFHFIICLTSCTTSGGALRVSTTAGEPDDGDYATLRGPNGDLLHLSHHITEEYLCNDHADDTSEEGKLLECVRDDSVTYASTRDLEPPMSSATMSPANSYITSPEHMMSPLAPVSVTVHSNEIHVSTVVFY